jgi:hypothetical protein
MDGLTRLQDQRAEWITGKRREEKPAQDRRVYINLIGKFGTTFAAR